MPESIDLIREQFDNAPYPRIPLENSPKNNYNALFTHNLATSHYLRHRQVVETQGKLILDAGCGSGWKSLILATANPGARIVGVDLSAESTKLAELRLKHHGFENVEFHAMLLENLPQLGMQFDYISCSDVLYLLPDPLAGLQAMKAVLAPDGIIHANLHSILQRSAYYRAQEFFRRMGLMERNPREEEFAIVRQTIQALKPTVLLKSQTLAVPEGEDGNATLLANQLLLGDKGFTVEQTFDLLDAAELEFVSMVNWRHWEVPDLFNNPDDLPALWGLSLMGAESRDRLRLYELLHPVNRLIDFWCAHPGSGGDAVSVEEWSEADWQGAIAHLHPQLCTEEVKTHLTQAIQENKPFEFNPYIDLPTMGVVLVAGAEAACLLPLLEGPQPVQALAARYRQICPVDPVTLEPTTLETACDRVCHLLNRLEAFLFVLLERQR